MYGKRWGGEARQDFSPIIRPNVVHNKKPSEQLAQTLRNVGLKDSYINKTLKSLEAQQLWLCHWSWGWHMVGNEKSLNYINLSPFFSINIESPLWSPLRVSESARKLRIQRWNWVKYIYLSPQKPNTNSPGERLINLYSNEDRLGKYEKIPLWKMRERNKKMAYGEWAVAHIL